MSNKTLIYLNYAERDQEAVEREFGNPQYEHAENGVISSQFWGPNYRGSEELTILAKNGIPFWGNNEECEEYGAALLASVNRRSYEFSVFPNTEILCVGVDIRTGRLLGRSEALKFRERWTRAKTAVINRAEKGKKTGENKS